MRAPAGARATPLPLLTLAVAAAALAAYLLPGLADAWIYDRAAIAAGQWWRLASGNLVHLSARHLAADVLAWVAIGSVLEARWRAQGRAGAVLGLYGGAGLAVGCAVLLGRPELTAFGGLSGMVDAALVALLLDGWRHDRAGRGLWTLGLALFAGKLALECAGGASVLTLTGTAGFVAVPQAHLAGALVALVQALATPGPICPILRNSW